MTKEECIEVIGRTYAELFGVAMVLGYLFLTPVFAAVLLLLVDVEESLALFVGVELFLLLIPFWVWVKRRKNNF